MLRIAAALVTQSSGSEMSHPAAEMGLLATSPGEVGTVETLLTLPFTGRGVSYSCDRVISSMQLGERSHHVTVPYLMGAQPSVPFQAMLPRRVGRMGRKLSPTLVQRLTEASFLRRLLRASSGTMAYLWSETSIGFARELHRRGHFTVREKTNCSKALSKQVLDDAYRRVGQRPPHAITDQAIQEEKERLALADAIFCPSDLVAQSLIKIGIPEERLLTTSYGFDPARFDNPSRLLPEADGVTFVFVGTICVRKGAHLILKAWARSGIKGRLVLAGAMEPVIEKISAQELARPDVIRLPYVQDVAALYNSADVFVFPSLEEGDPLVTREAAYCGLPSIVSPMGAGRVVRDGKEGYVLDPYAENDWVEALRLLASQAGLRERMGQTARQRALRFTWAEVGRRRREALVGTPQKVQRRSEYLIGSGQLIGSAPATIA